jgi:acetyl esterase/lipase
MPARPPATGRPSHRICSQNLLQRTRLAARLLLLLPAFLMAGCSVTDLLNAAAPDDRVTRDQPYGSHLRQRYDLYQPATVTAETPLIVFFYGGGWESGDRKDYRFVAATLADQGWLVAVPDYRLWPDVSYPVFLEDAAAAVARILADRKTSDADKHRPVFLVGHSAGAWMAVMLGLNPAPLTAAGVNPNRITGIAGLAGPYDFLPWSTERLRTIFRDGGRETQPIQYARADAPPVLLLHGLSDITVKPGNSERLAARLREQGAPVTLTLYPGVGHAPLIGAMAGPLRFLAPTLTDLSAFIRQVSANRPTPQAGGAAQ